MIKLHSKIAQIDASLYYLWVWYNSVEVDISDMLSTIEDYLCD